MSQIVLLCVLFVNEGVMMTQDEFKEEARQLRPQLMKVARCYLSDDDAEDTVQDVLLRLWQMVDEVRRPLAPLALRLTRNLCIDKVRRRRTNFQLIDSDDDNDAEEV